MGRYDGFFEIVNDFENKTRGMRYQLMDMTVDRFKRKVQMINRANSASGIVIKDFSVSDSFLKFNSTVYYAVQQMYKLSCNGSGMYGSSGYSGDDVMKEIYENNINEVDVIVAEYFRNEILPKIIGYSGGSDYLEQCVRRSGYANISIDETLMGAWMLFEGSMYCRIIIGTDSADESFEGDLINVDQNYLHYVVQNYINKFVEENSDSVVNKYRV